MTVNEADTCRKFVLPKLYAVGWTDDQISEQKSFTDGRIVVVGDKVTRKEQKRADYILRYRRDFPIAIVEAKASFKKPGDGLQQAKNYAEILGLKFAYSTNGHEIIEHDYLTGKETKLTEFPAPSELWTRLQQNSGISEEATEKLLSPYHRLSKKEPRYYQEIAINGAVQAVLQGKPRILLTLATGTGKTFISFQIAWKLWSSRWNRKDEHRRPRILFLSDRNVLVDEPYSRDFAAFGDARHRIQGEAVKSREIYFATYQSIAQDERRPGLFRDYAPDFFDLIIIDECHRGSAGDDSNWREILEYFTGATQIGMTATPLRQDNVDTYRYFGNPLYIYSLRQGIEDGFLAPYRVHRVVTNVDATGWRPMPGDTDRYGREIPDGEYGSKDFERILAFRKRTEAVARHLTEYMKKTDPYAKTIVFCVDQEHAEDMRMALNNLNADLVRDNPDYVCRITADEGKVGRGFLDRFMELETKTPVIVTTSKLLSTGVDVQMCKNIVIFRSVNSMTEFKQIIGRGTRVRDDYGKLYFTILDYIGSATMHFADPDFDGQPALVTEEEIDEAGETIEDSEEVVQPEEEVDVDDPVQDEQTNLEFGDGENEPRKFYYDGGSVVIATSVVYELDADGRRLRVVRLTEYVAEKVREMYPSAAALRSKWSKEEEREVIIKALEERGIAFEQLAEATHKTDADPFDLLCNIAYNAPLRTRRERAEMVRKNRLDFFDRYSPEARGILCEILDKYIEHGVAQLSDPNILKIPPLSERGTVIEIAAKFGGPDKMRSALVEMQNLIYAA